MDYFIYIFINGYDDVMVIVSNYNYYKIYFLNVNKIKFKKKKLVFINEICD